MLTDQNQTGIPSSSPMRGRTQLTKPVQTYNTGRVSQTPTTPAQTPTPSLANSNMQSQLSDQTRTVAENMLRSATPEQLAQVITMLRETQAQPATDSVAALMSQLSPQQSNPASPYSIGSRLAMPTTSLR